MTLAFFPLFSFVILALLHHKLMMLRRFEMFGWVILCFPFFPLVDDRFCHLESDRLFSRSDEPCHCVVDYVLPRGSVFFISVGTKPP